MNEHTAVKDELVKLFRTAARNQIAVLAEGLGDVADTSALWPGKKEEFCNICHNLKGQGSSFGYPLITQIGTSLNKMLKGLEEFDPRCAAIAQAHVRALNTVLEKNIQGAGGAVGLALVQRLQELSSEVD